MSGWCLQTKQACISLQCTAAAGLLTSSASVLEELCCKRLSSCPTAGAVRQPGCKLCSHHDITITVMQPVPTTHCSAFLRYARLICRRSASGLRSSSL